jgi:C-terminal processing protease CtpA/Prc
LLIDDLSSSAAEGFAAIVQDNRRAMLYGYRTGGLGGAVLSTSVGFYMEARARYTYSILIRNALPAVPGYPDEPYIENIGVHPDKVSDTATVEFIATKGKAWMEKMVADAAEYVNSKKTTSLP